MWIVYFFEIQIMNVYKSNISPINFYSFVNQKIKITDVMKQISQIIGKQYTYKDHNSIEQKIVIEASPEERPFLLKQCEQKLQCSDRDLGQVIDEFVWVQTDVQNKVNKIFKILCYKMHNIYQSYLEEKKIQQIEQMLKKKKKKKKIKMKKQEQQQQHIITAEKNEEKELSCKEQVLSQEILSSKCIPTENLPEQLQNEQKIQKIKRIDPKIKKIENEHQRELQNVHKQQQTLNRLKKVISERMNEYLYSLYIQLKEDSQKLDKYRRASIENIKACLQEELKIKCDWQLVLFGSFSINFSLRQSDLDLVMIIEDSGECSLTDLYNVLCPKEWLKNCHIIKTARVPIIQFKVIVANLKHLKGKQIKRAQNVLIHVDISICSSKSNHEGIGNTKFISELFDSYPNLKVICLILKQLLRQYELNKPFTGGISSFVLVILVYSILKMTNIELNQNYLLQIKKITQFMSNNFESYITLISANRKTKVKPSTETILNIENPIDGHLLVTNAQLIDKIIEIFCRFDKMLDNIKNELLSIEVQEKKKMKRIFFEKVKELFMISDF